jgi:hypothetical protein
MNMNKTLVAIAAAFLAVTTLCSAAEAGFKVRIGFGFPIGGFNAHHGGGYAHRHHRRHRYVVRRAKKKVHVAKAKTYVPKKVTKVAKVEPAVVATPEPVIKAETENSSITPVEATEPVAETSSTEKTAETTANVAADPVPVADEPTTANKLDCKKFFPSVGMTLSVPCE